MDIRTDKQKARMAFDIQLAKAYTCIKEEHPNSTPTRICEAMAKSGLYKYRSGMGIKKALERANVEF